MSQEEGLFQAAIGPLRLTALACFALILGLAFWMYFAQVTTVVRATGRLVSAEPSFDLQHPFGGQILRIHSALHDELEKDQLIIELDVSKQVKMLEKLNLQVLNLRAENDIIRAMLAGQTEQPETETSRRFIQLHREMLINVSASEQNLQALRAQRAATEVARAHLEESRLSLAAQNRKMEKIVEKGFRTEEAQEDRRQQYLRLQSELSRMQADLVSLSDRAEQARTQAVLYRESFEKDLRARLSDNLRQLPGLERQIIELDEEIRNAEIRAPIRGAISSLNFSTAGMYIPRGQSILTLSKPLAEPEILLDIPLDVIDQVRTGMTAWVTINGLPQRNLGRISARIVSISSQAQRDEAGVPISYKATARFDDDSLTKALEGLSIPVSLAQDMSLGLAIEGRKTTVADFLITPFFESFGAAFQD